MNEKRDVKYIGVLPDGYNYHMSKVGDVVRLVGIASEKEPILLEIIDDKIIDVTARDQYDR
jgi:hypothetical protein